VPLDLAYKVGSRGPIKTLFPLREAPGIGRGNFTSMIAWTMHKIPIGKREVV